jgi:hypothetical protein
MRTILLFLAAAVMLVLTLTSQESYGQMRSSNTGGEMENMPGMNMKAMPASCDMDGMSTQSSSFIGFLQSHSTSGTDAEPNSTPSEMLMSNHKGWTFMLHGVAFLNAIQQTGPRGADKLFSTNWIMPMAARRLGHGTLTLRTMLSLEPATISGQRYPELFEVGETAYGRPIVDGQHPHNFFMELAASYDYTIGENTMLSFYAAPVGGPAMGPAAFPHRASASEDPIAPLGHHLEDSTHIADDVLTVGITRRIIRFEASGFHGREPDEFRWDIDSGKIDSWSTRVTLNPGRSWSGQFSIAHLHSPEMIAPTEDVRRMTASLVYNRPLRSGNWATTLIWGRNQSLLNGNVGNGYLGESTLRFLGRNYGWTRIENVDRTNEILLIDKQALNNFSDRYIARIQAYTAGYDREVGNIPHLSTAIGGQVTWYGMPQTLRPVYSPHPVGVVLFLRVRTR